MPPDPRCSECPNRYAVWLPSARFACFGAAQRERRTNSNHRTVPNPLNGLWSVRSAAPAWVVRRLEFRRPSFDYVIEQRFGKDRVILLGHSWGTVLGIIYAYEYPEKVAAYAGVAQIANFAKGERLSYEWALSQAIQRDNRRAIADLRAMSRRPRSVDDELTKGKWVEVFGGMFHQGLSTWRLILAAGSADEANLVDLVKFGQGNRFSLESLRPEYSKIDLTRYQSFRVPIIFLLGRYDWHVPSVLAERYFDTVAAPCKRLIWFEQSAHNPPFEEPEQLVRVMTDEVLPPVVEQSNACMESVSPTKYSSRSATPAAELGR
jgi:pimeloyl-ACP methyl ester carboxylesterase